MQKNWINDLKNSDPNVRKRAIFAMAESRDADALKVLKYVYEKDADPQIREIAKKAGAHLWKTLKTDKATAPTVKIENQENPIHLPAHENITQQPPQPKEASGTSDPFELPEASPISMPSVDINSKQIATARIHVTRATALIVKGQRTEALRYLQNACHINPELLNEDLVINLAGELTGLPKQEALQAMMAMKSSPSTQSATTQNRTMLYVGIGIGVIAVLIIVAVLIF